MKIKSIIILILVTATICGSCGSRRTKIDSKNLIPEKDLVPILRDLYLADGLIGMPRIMLKYAPFDSISTYNHLIEEHGYTKEAMDRTMKYYFVRDPKKLIKIYDKVLGILSVMELRIQKEIIKSKPRTSTLWPGYEFYSFPDPSDSDSTSFRITADKQGFYILSATITLYPDDKSFSPAISAMAFNPDSLATGKLRFARSSPFIKDGYPHKYKISFNVPPRSKLQIEGDLYSPFNMTDLWDRHLVIQNVTLLHSPFDQ